MKRLVGFYIVLLGLASCVKSPKFTNLDSAVILPLATVDLSIKDILADSLYTENGDNSISLIYRQNIFENTIDSIFYINTKSYQNTASLQSLELAAQTLQKSISLGDMALQAGVTGEYIINQNGSNSIIPPLFSLESGPFEVDANQFFQAVELLEGTMEIEIINNFPTDVSNLAFEIRNAADESLVATETFTYIAAGSSEVKAIDMSGKTIYGDLTLYVSNIDVVGTGVSSVLIDTSDAVISNITVRDLVLASATAYFPAQNIVDTAENRALADMGDVQLTKAIIESGKIRMEAYSTVSDTVYFSYTLPGTKKDGIPFTMDLIIPPATQGNFTYEEIMKDVSGYEFDFTGRNGDTINTFYTEVQARIDSTGKLATISLQDSVYLLLEVLDLIPNYVHGYLGQDTIRIGPNSKSLDVFDFIPSGVLQFETVNVSLNLEHALGIQAEGDVQRVTAVNSKKNQEVALDFSAFNLPLSINKANDTIEKSVTSYFFDSNNSNTDALFNIMPDRLDYDISVYTNTEGNNFSYSDFASKKYPFSANLDVEIPLSIKTNNLLLVDTVSFDYSSNNKFENIISPRIILEVTNELPIAASIKLYFLEKGVVLDSLISNQIIQGAFVEENGALIEGARSELIYPIEESFFQDLKLFDQVILKASLETFPNSDFVKILSTNNIKCSLRTDFELKLN